MQNLYFSTGKDVFLEFGSGSNAMLLGPFAGSGLTAIAEEIEVIEYEMEIQEEEEGTTTNPTTMKTTSTATSSTATASVSASSKEAPVVAASTTTSSGALEMGGEANAEGDPIVDTPSTATSSTATASVSVLAGDPKAPDTFLVTLRTTVVGENGVSEAGNSIVIKVIRAWAPLGADHFHALVMDDFYTEAAFFRVVPNFVVQFGIAGIPAMNKKWETPIKDDPVLQSNKAKTLVYATAGPNTRTSQLFINYKDNTNLDSQGFAPFGEIVSGFEYAQEIFNPTPGSSDGVDQGQYEAKGNDWIKKQYPKVDFIVNATIG